MKAVAHPPRGGAPAALRKSALELFVSKGYHGVGIREIAKAVGLSEAALYRHWKGKQELAIDVFSSHVAEVNELLEKSLDAPLIEALPAASAAVCKLFDDRPLVFRFVLLMQHELAMQLPDDVRMPMDVIGKRLERARSEIAGDPQLISAALIGIFIQTATYVLYGRIAGPLSLHRDAIARSALAVLRG